MTNQLVFLETGKASLEPFTTSKVIAEMTGIEHRKIKVAIRKHQEDIESFGLSASYQAESSGGRPEEIIKLNEAQATFLMTLLKNTPVVVAFKKELVRQFYAMRRLLLERQSAQWRQARDDGKAVRRLETDAIKAFVAYAAANVSKRPEMYYKHFTAMVCKALGIESGKRDVLPVSVLLNLRTAEQAVDRAIRMELAAGTEYHQAFQNVKAKVGQLTALVFAPLPAQAAQPPADRPST